jgi:flagellar hook-associated protein 3 FlgL
MTIISTIATQTRSITYLQQAQKTLDMLNNQMSSGVKSQNLADYSGSDTRHLLDLRGALAKHTSYVSVINAVQPRVKIYDSSFTRFEDITQKALNLINQAAPSSSQADSAGVKNQVTDNLREIQAVLNENVDGRYIFSGTRFTTEPVGDLNALPSPPTETAPYYTTDPTLPVYDKSAPASDTTAFATDTVKIDDSLTLPYGMTSNSKGMQEMIQGLRFMKAATQDPTNYTAYMAKAKDLLTAAQTDLRALHSQIAADNSLLNNAKDTHTTLINSMTIQSEDVQRVDTTEVAAKITYMQSLMQASYSSTAILAKLSIANYLN